MFRENESKSNFNCGVLSHRDRLEREKRHVDEKAIRQAMLAKSASETAKEAEYVR